MDLQDKDSIKPTLKKISKMVPKFYAFLQIDILLAAVIVLQLVISWSTLSYGHKALCVVVFFLLVTEAYLTRQFCVTLTEGGQRSPKSELSTVRCMNLFFCVYIPGKILVIISNMTEEFTFSGLTTGLLTMLFMIAAKYNKARIISKMMQMLDPLEDVPDLFMFLADPEDDESEDDESQNDTRRRPRWMLWCARVSLGLSFLAIIVGCVTSLDSTPDWDAATSTDITSIPPNLAIPVSPGSAQPITPQTRRLKDCKQCTDSGTSKYCTKTGSWWGGFGGALAGLLFIVWKGLVAAECLIFVHPALGAIYALDEIIHIALVFWGMSAAITTGHHLGTTDICASAITGEALGTGFQASFAAMGGLLSFFLL